MKNNPFLSEEQVSTASGITQRQKDIIKDMSEMVDRGDTGVEIRTPEDALAFSLNITEEDVALINPNEFFQTDMVKSITGGAPSNINIERKHVLSVIRVFSYQSLLKVLNIFNTVNTQLISALASLGYLDIKPGQVVDMKAIALYSSEAGLTAVSVQIHINHDFLDSIESIPLLMAIGEIVGAAKNSLDSNR